MALLTIEKCFKWGTDSSPPSGITSGTFSCAESMIETAPSIQGTIVKRMRPYVDAYVGPDRKGHMEAWAKQNLIYEIPPPINRMNIRRTSIELSALVAGNAHSGNFKSASSNPEDGAGAFAKLELNVHIEQNVIYPSGLRENKHTRITSDQIWPCEHGSHSVNSVYSSSIAIGVVCSYGGHINESNDNRKSINMDHRLFDIGKPFTIYGSSLVDPHEIIGENVRVYVDCYCRAVANYRRARAYIGCPDAGQYISIHKIILDEVT